MQSVCTLYPLLKFMGRVIRCWTDILVECRITKTERRDKQSGSRHDETEQESGGRRALPAGLEELFTKRTHLNRSRDTTTLQGFVLQMITVICGATCRFVVQRHVCSRVSRPPQTRSTTPSTPRRT